MPRDRSVEKQRYWAQLRTDVLYKYGGQCVACGEPRYAWLDVDHVNDDGKEERRSMESVKWYLYLRRTERRADLQLLCVPCHARKTHEEKLRKGLRQDYWT